MRRDFGGGPSIGPRHEHEEDADPRVGLVNLADIMLVFACGLMVSIVMNWNVNLAEVTEISDSASKVDDVESMAESMRAGEGYAERGTVYQDPETGQLYLLEEPDAEEA